MTEVAIRTSRFSAFADITFAYSLAYVLQLYAPTQIFASQSFAVPSQAFELTVLGGLISSFLFLVDPINRAIRLRLSSLLKSPNAPRKIWARQLLDKMNLDWVAPGTEDDFFVARAKSAYWSPYLSKQRAQTSGGIVFSAVLFGLFPQALLRDAIVAAFALLVLGGITLYSVYRDIKTRIPQYCWIVAVYGLMVESKSKDDIRNLDGITKHLADSNWDEASWWLKYELEHKSRAEKH